MEQDHDAVWPVFQARGPQRDHRVGAVGSIYKSTDQGASFSELSRVPRLQLTSVSAIDKNTAWAAGFGGLIARTVDGGTTWSTALDDTHGVAVQTTAFYEVSAVSATTAWAAGGNQQTVLKTVDGGATWVAQTGFGTPVVTSVAVVDANTIWIAGANGFIAKTANGGTNWTVQSSGTSRGTFNLYPFNAQVAYASYDDGSWRRTGDGGTTWTLAAGFDNQFISIVPLDANTLVGVSLKGVIKRSSDGGTTFVT